MGQFLMENRRVKKYTSKKDTSNLFSYFLESDNFMLFK